MSPPTNADISPAIDVWTLQMAAQPDSVPVKCLNTQSHDGVDNIVVILLQCLDGLFAADTGLGHDQLNVLVLKTLGVHLLAVILLFVLLGLAVLGVLARLAVVVAGVVTLGTGGGELLSSGLLGGSVDVLDLGFTENTGKDCQIVPPCCLTFSRATNM